MPQKLQIQKISQIPYKPTRFKHDDPIKYLWGGRRENAGRKNNTKTVNHMRRPTISLNRPMHITMRLKKDLPNLRQKRTLAAFARRVHRAKDFGLHVLHFSLQSNHLHMIVEATTRRQLANGLRSLGGSFGKYLRRRKGGTGAIFHGRYHLRVITSARQMRNTLRYVLLNHAKHQRMIEHLDFFSSGFLFKNWRKLLGGKLNTIIATEIKIIGERNLPHDLWQACVSPPRSWIARYGWQLVI